jgi:hypothetical protein
MDPQNTKFQLNGKEYDSADLNEEQQEMLAGISIAQRQCAERRSEVQLMELATSHLIEGLIESLEKEQGNTEA